MAYQIPRVEISEIFLQNSIFAEQPLNAAIIGPNYDLHRYNVASEKATTVVTNPTTPSLANAYQFGGDVDYAYPFLPTNTVVDQSYVKVYMEKAEAKYLPSTDLGSSGSAAAAAFVLAPSSVNYNNRLRFTDASTTVLKTANGYTRSAYLANRDVQVGDTVTVLDNLGNALKTKVKSLIADTAAEDSSLAAVLNQTFRSGSDGVVSGGSLNVFTSAGGAFDQTDVGHYLTINTKGTYKILVVNSTTSVVLDRNSTTGTTLTYSVKRTYNDTANVNPQSAAFAATPTYSWVGSGSDPGTGTVTISSATTGAYVGYASKRITSDTYAATVTTAGNLTAVRFTVESAQGAFSALTNQALSAAVLTLDSSNGNDVQWDFTSSTAFTVGQKWTVTVTALVAQVQATVTGTYSGSTDIRYKIYVARGGKFYTGSNSDVCALLQISASTADVSSSVFVATPTAFTVGSFGVSAAFSAGSGEGGTALILGDAYYIDVKAAVIGKVKTVELNDALTDALLANSAGTRTAFLSLVRDSVVIPYIADLVAGTHNWTTDTDSIVVKAGITTTDSSLIVGLTYAKLPILVGNIFVEYRTLLRTTTASVDTVSSLAEVATKLGTVHPDNPLAQGTYEAILNAKSTAVYFLGVNTDDLDGYNTALTVLKFKKGPYGVVPLTEDTAIQDAVVSHVDAMSTKEEAKWRVCWLCRPLVASAYIYDKKPDLSNWTGTITDDPITTGTQYTFLTVAGATFLTDGVRVGDTLEVNFSLSTDGTIVATSYLVAAIRTETTIALATGPATPINVPTQIKIRRTYTKQEQATTLASVGGDFNDRRVRMVFPDTVKTGNVDKSGIFLAAALAGLRSGVVPHQGLTNIEVLGFDDVSKALTYFNADQLNLLAEQGLFIVTQNSVGATPYVRHQLTTDTSSLNTSEDSATTNIDSIAYSLQSRIAPYIGKYNRNPETTVLLKDEVNAEIRFRQTGTFTSTAGYQLLADSKLLSIIDDPDFKDKTDIQIQAAIPYPLNRVGILLITL